MTEGRTVTVGFAGSYRTQFHVLWEFKNLTHISESAPACEQHHPVDPGRKRLPEQPPWIFEEDVAF